MNMKDRFDGQNALIFAARYGNFHLLELLVDAGTRIDEKDSYGQTALQWCAWKVHVDGMKVIIGDSEELIDGTIGYDRFKSLLWTTEGEVDIDPVLLLIRKGADYKIRDHMEGVDCV